MAGSNEKSVVIVGASRTAIGGFLGAFAQTPAPALGAAAISAALRQSGLSPEKVESCWMGNVLTAGLGQAPARQAALKAGLLKTTDCTTVNKVCSSGLKAVMLAADAIQLGRNSVVIAGGQENMSLAPHLLENSRSGTKMGPGTLTDSMIKDGLWDPYHNFHMGKAGELCAKEYKVSREEQDQYAIESYKRAQAAQKDGTFAREITPVSVTSGKDTVQVTLDEEPMKAKFDKMPGLKPAFDSAGTITAANASKVNDGAAAVVLMNEAHAREMGVKPLVRVLAQATHSHEPEWFTTAPVSAMKKLLNQAGLKASQIDFWEINEAFSVVAMVAMRELGIEHARMNVTGGAVALGHPIGASGARILTTLINTLQTRGGKYGVASLCNGGGEATALLIERC
ncbi:MAG TPA: thiolase family protein [Bdellovibrionales bacterium]|nr:thiolase family protein [Bdellovibrionales bacterium]